MTGSTLAPSLSAKENRNKKKTTYESKWFHFCDLGGTRTHGPLIKSQLLYQLSYEVIFDLHGRAMPILRVQICNNIFNSARIAGLIFFDVVINVCYIIVFIQFIQNFINFGSLFRR